MNWIRLLACGLVFVAMVSAAPSPPSNAARELEGLWAARVRYGPDIRGPLIVSRRNRLLVAEIAGRLAEVKIFNRDVSFDLAGDAGAFRGRLASGDRQILGHWIQPRANSGGGQKYASPVTLLRDGFGRWRGDVMPFDDAMTMFLVLSPGENGVTRAFIRNPERNVGAVMNAVRLERTGNTLRLIGRPRGGETESVIATGFYDENNELMSLYFGNFGTTIDFARGDAEAERDYFPRGRDPAPHDYEPPPLEDGWTVDTLEDVGISRQAISALVKEIVDTPMGAIDASQIHSVLIARHGKLVFEEYFHGFHRGAAHDTRSAAKVLTSVLTGAAIRSGAPFTPLTKVVDAVDPSLLPAKIDPRLAAMRVEDLLTMSSGFDCDDNDPSSPGNEDTMQEQRKELNWWRYTLAVPMAREPGKKAIYCSINPNLVGAVLIHETGRWLPDLFHDLVAQPLQIDRYYMNLTPTGDAYTGGGVFMKPRDFLKLGQLVLNKGVWHGHRVVSSAWIETSTAPLFEMNAMHYGYLWWVVDVLYGARTLQTVQALGNGGQVVIAIPALDLVVGFMGGNYGNGAPSDYPRRVLLPKYILPAVREN